MDSLCNRRSHQLFTRPGRTLAPAIAAAIAATLAVGAWLLAGFLIAALMGPFGTDPQSPAVTAARLTEAATSSTASPQDHAA